MKPHLMCVVSRDDICSQRLGCILATAHDAAEALQNGCTAPGIFHFAGWRGRGFLLKVPTEEQRVIVMDQVELYVKPVKDFAKDSMRLVKRCTKPDLKGERL